MSRAVENAGFVQDVVIATTHLLHRADLTADQLISLERCRGLLRSADADASSEGDGGLEATRLEPGESASLRRATRVAFRVEPGTIDEALRVLGLVLSGETLEQDDLAVVAHLRDAFASIGRANLESVNASRTSEGETGLWQALATSSLS